MGEYRVSVLLSAPEGTIVEVLAAGQAARAEVSRGGWQRLVVGVVELASDVRLNLSRADGAVNEVAVKSVELEHVDDVEARLARADLFRGAACTEVERLRASRLGLMFQYGPWSFGLDAERPGIDRHVDDFDVHSFVDRVVTLGAQHVVWSLSWYTYQLASPLSSVLDITGDPSLVSKRDLIGEVAAALAERGIQFFLYYHPGHDGHLTYGTTPWWRAQDWPEEFTKTGLGDREQFFENTRRVLEEAGEWHGETLSGWFLDDGLIYYPAPFEMLGRALRAGNDARLISYNSWIMPSFTDFEDVAFGEGLHSFDGIEVDARGS